MKLCSGRERPRQRKEVCTTLFQLFGFGTSSVGVGSRHNRTLLCGNNPCVTRPTRKWWVVIETDQLPALLPAEGAPADIPVQEFAALLAGELTRPPANDDLATPPRFLHC